MLSLRMSDQSATSPSNIYFHLSLQVRLAGLGVGKCKDVTVYHNAKKGNKLRKVRFQRETLRHYKNLYRRDWGVVDVYFCYARAYTDDSQVHPMCNAKWGKD